MKAPAADSLDGAPVVTAIAQVALACSDLVGVRRCADETPRRPRAGRLASALTTARVASVSPDMAAAGASGRDRAGGAGTDRKRWPRRVRCRRQRRLHGAFADTLE